jgi:hypothetical protein
MSVIAASRTRTRDFDKPDPLSAVAGMTDCLNPLFHDEIVAFHCPTGRTIGPKRKDEPMNPSPGRTRTRDGFPTIMDPDHNRPNRS